jgi:hypothetical protein
LWLAASAASSKASTMLAGGAGKPAIESPNYGTNIVSRNPKCRDDLGPSASVYCQ